MIRSEQDGDVTRFELSHARSRLIGFSVSVYLVRGALIDSGFPAVGSEVEGLVTKHGARGALITHGHEDHAGNVERLARIGVPLAVSERTLERVRAPRRIRAYRRWTWGSPSPLTSPIVPFTDADLQLLSTPGHAEDHHVVWDAREGTLFSSDLYLGVRVPVAHASERPRRLLQSLRDMIALGPVRMFDAHRGAIHDPVRALQAKSAWLEGLIGNVERLIAQGLDDRAIQLTLLGKEGLPGFISGGEYSKRNLIAAIRNEERAANRQTDDPRSSIND